MPRFLKLLGAIMCGFYLYRLYDKVTEPWRFFIFAVPMTALIVAMQATEDPKTFGFCATALCWLLVSRTAYLYLSEE